MADKADIALELKPGKPLARKILLVAGEESGDMYAGRICAHLLRMVGGLKIEGIGGPRMRAAGAHTFYDISQMSSVGVASMLGRLRFFLGVLNELKTKIAEGEYDAVILIDYPDFNMRIAKAADRGGLPVFYYVCPQFWAWRRYRLRAVKKYIDMMLVVFPFEEEFYTKRRINARFIGHPVLDELAPTQDREGFRENLGVGKGRTLLGLLPGSRVGEVSRMLPLMLSAVKIIRAHKAVNLVIGCADSIDPGILARHIEESGEEAAIVENSSWEMMNACDYLICKSGTSTLQALLANTPMQIVYRSDNFSYLLARSLTHVKWAGLPNLLAKRKIVPELIQWSMTPQNMASAALHYFNNPEAGEKMRSELARIGESLGEPGASARAAKSIIGYLKKFQSL
ncbi:MAG TPA: lipid-A-disaccharide synthase [Nitrospirae bacterium]|nr:lipid-A-disaccharide synthase [Nitrospirota bacterium]